MTKKQSVSLYGTAFLWVCSLAAGAAELFGVSVCLFGTPLHQYLAVPICLFSVLLCILLCKRIGAAEETCGARLAKLLRAACITLCTVMVLATVLLSALTAVHYTGQAVSPDKSYKIFYETEAEDSEPVAHLYRRYSPFLVRYCTSAVLYDCIGSPREAELTWAETYCAVSYTGYGDDAQSAEELQWLTRKLYYDAADRN